MPPKYATDDKIAFQSKTDHPRMYLVTVVLLFCTCDLLLDQLTLIYELDLDILKMYLHAKVKSLRQGSTLELEQNRQTEKRDRINTL